jgi:hypothetical protein
VVPVVPVVLVVPVVPVEPGVVGVLAAAATSLAKSETDAAATSAKRANWSVVPAAAAAAVALAAGAGLAAVVCAKVTGEAARPIAKAIAVSFFMVISKEGGLNVKNNNGSILLRFLGPENLKFADNLKFVGIYTTSLVNGQRVSVSIRVLRLPAPGVLAHSFYAQFGFPA